MLDDLGLLPALLWYFERYTAQTNVRVNLTHRGLQRRFQPEVETAAFRIIQEALTNVARHAQVEEVGVRLSLTPRKLSLYVKDKGRGFDPEPVLAGGGSSGVAGMTERAALLGGHLEVESAPGAGTTLAAEIPLNGAQRKTRKEKEA
jgi:signal transduction histidine kinase